MIFSYTKIVEPGPNGYTLYARLPEGGLELCTLDGITYVTVPGDADMPDQHPEIALEEVVVDSALRDRILKESRACQLISQAVIDKIRSQYSVDDEAYFARIGVGVALGAYQFEAGEQEAMLAFGAYVEACRQWGRAQRAALGL